MGFLRIRRSADRSEVTLGDWPVCFLAYDAGQSTAAAKLRALVALPDARRRSSQSP